MQALAALPILLFILLAIAGRIGVELKLEDFDTIGSKIPLLVNLKPSGKYLMEDFYYAGGLPVVIKELKKYLHNECITVNGKSIGENNSNPVCYNSEVIATIDEPLQHECRHCRAERKSYVSMVPSSNHLLQQKN